MNSILSAENITKIYSERGRIDTVLDNINLNIKRGDFIGIMGPSGAGKTTLLNVISTISKPTSGNIVINNTDISNLNEEEMSIFRRNNLGFVFQDFNLIDILTVKENILLPLIISNTSLRNFDKRIKEIINIFGIENILDKYPNELSVGEKQKISTARAIINDPTLILADEPTGALDSRSANDLLTALNKLNIVYNTTILIVTHDIYTASFCRKIIFMKDGKFFNELIKGKSHKQFFGKIVDILKVIGGGSNDII